MPEVTYNNHLSSYIKNNEYRVKTGKCSNMPMSFKEEAIRAANLIKQQAADKDIWISFSGGIDSEFIINVFLDAGIDINIATVVMKDETNNYDLQYSRNFCNNKNLTLHEYKIDLEKFYKNDLLYYAENTRSISPQFPVHMWLWDQLDGYIVAGHGDPIFKRKDSGWMFQVQEKEDSIYRYAEWRDRDMASGFFAYTPELLLSFMLEKEVSNMFLAPKKANLRDIIQVKHKVYSKYYDIKERDKKTGFEKTATLDLQYREKLKRTINGHGVFLQPVEDLFDRLWPNNEN